MSELRFDGRKIRKDISVVVFQIVQNGCLGPIVDKL